MNGLLDKDIDHLGQILATCKLQSLDLSDNRITLTGFVRIVQNIPNCLKSFDFFGNAFDADEAACHTLTLFKEHPHLWEDGFNWNHSKSPMRPEIEHFKDFNRCGKILLAPEVAIPLSFWPFVLARANTLLEGYSNWAERTPNAIFHLLQGPALMQRKFDGEADDAPFARAGKRATRFSKRLASAATGKANAETAKKSKFECLGPG
jgi:Ser/Thr protein kinase RdoA (MazF antagonist)